MKSRNIMLLCAAAPAALSVGGMAHAQSATAPAAGAANLDADSAREIVVTATKRSESINRVPMTITAVTGDNLKRLGVQEVSDLIKVVPGFIAVQGQVGAGRSYFLRGVGYYNYNLSGRPTVTLYEDEGPLPYSPMAVGVDLDLERVEVLKGPQGTLFGSNSTGGAINFVAAKPTDHFTAGFDGSYGRFNEANLSGFVSGPIWDNVRVRLAVAHQGRSDWQQNYVNNTTLGSKDLTAARATIEATPNDRLKIRFTASGVIDKSDTQAAQLVDKTGALPFLATQPLAPANARAANFSTVLPLGAKNQNDNYQIRSALRFDYEATDSITLTSLTSYVYNRQRFGQDPDGSMAQIADYYIPGHIKTFSQELRAAGSIAGSLRWIVGANYESSKTLENQYVFSRDGAGANGFNGLGLPPLSMGLSYARTHDTSKAVFGNVDFDVSQVITLHGGVRYTKTKSRFEGCQISVGNDTVARGLSILLGVPFVGSGNCLDVGAVNGVVQNVGLQRLSLPEDNVSFRAGVDFKPVAGTLIYGSVSRGYKAGQFANIGGAFADRYAPVQQERVIAYEAGVKSSLIPNMLQVNGALFYYDYANKQLQGRKQVPIFGFLQALVSVPESRVKGAELEVTLRPAQGLTLTGSGTYVSTKIKGNFLSFTAFGVQQQLAGSSFPFTPRWQANFGADYHWPLNGSLNGMVGANAVYRSKSYGDFVKNQILAINAYTVIDARIGVEASDQRWKAELYGRNITNKYYWTSVIRAQQATYRFAGMPATYGISVSYRY